MKSKRGDGMTIQLTGELGKEYEALRYGRLTPKMAAEYLKDGNVVLRPFHEVLRELYPHDDIREKITDALLQRHPETLPDSVDRRVRNWLRGENRPTDREDIFLIAFSLSLSEEETNRLLGFCTDYGIHYRDGKDIVYAWFLRKGKTYCEAKAFYEALPPVTPQQELPNDRTHISKELRDGFRLVETEEELRQWYMEKLCDMGRLHMRAHRYFDRYLESLTHPSADWNERDEGNYSLEAVMKTYLSLSMPSGKNRQRYTTVQRFIKQGWPNTTLLRNIRLQKEDVPRKLLILLYVVTENIVTGEESEDDLLLESKVEDHWYALNAILTDCGMPTLDPRNPWDWLALYTLTAGSEESMSDRMRSVVEEVFRDL